MNLSRLPKVILGAVATIILGAVGSGLWEKVLSPLLGYFANRITSILSALSSSYSDSIYSQASRLYAPSPSDRMAIVIMFLIFMGVFVYAVRSKRENVIIKALHQGMAEAFTGWRGIVYSGSFVVLLIFLASRQTTIEEIRSYSTTQMEIVRPYVGEEKYHQLKSRFLRMRSKKDFDRFLHELYSGAPPALVKVEKFEKR